MPNRLERARELLPPATHYRLVRGALALTLGISLGMHVVVAAALVAPRTRPAPLDPEPELAGATFELPAPETAELASGSFSEGLEAHEALGSAASSPAEADAPARPTRPPVGATRAARSTHARAPSQGAANTNTSEASSGSAAAPALYGAVGERSATDLATAFTRGFPQAASADRAWVAAPLGSAGEADVILTLDDSGHLENASVVGSPSPALASAIRRTLALIKGRTFVAKGKITKLSLAAKVSADAVHDGLHGDVFAIGGSFAGGEGNAFFALAIGRRIDVRVRLR